MSEDQEFESEEEQTLAQQNIDRMDRCAQRLMDLIESDDTPARLKPQLFAQVASWQRMRKILAPDEKGNRLKEMSDHVKSTGSKGNRSAKRTDGRSKDGAAIRRIQASLPRFGSNNVNANSNVSGDTKNPEREGGGINCGGWRFLPDDDRDVPSNSDGARDSD